MQKMNIPTADQLAQSEIYIMKSDAGIMAPRNKHGSTPMPLPIWLKKLVGMCAAEKR